MLISNNYFKAHGHTFSFIDTVPESIESAFASARLVSENPSVYRPIPEAGPWDACAIIGHRARGVILRDLDKETKVERLENLHYELSTLDSRYFEIGRVVPLTAVAA